MSLERFIKVFASISLEERKLTIAIINDQPVSWIRAYEEIRNNTKLGKKIQEKLEKDEII